VDSSIPERLAMKKQQPLIILRAIEPIYTSIDKEYFNLVREGDALLRVEDADPESSFFFEILGSFNSNHGPMFRVRQAPYSPSVVEPESMQVKLELIQGTYTNWVKLVKSYDAVKSKYDDPIIEKYTEDFYEELTSADPDAEEVSFDLRQQLLIDQALTQVIHLLRERKDESNKEVVEALVGQAEEIQATLTSSTKQETFTKLAKLFARIQKLGLKFIKDVHPVFQKEIIGYGIKKLIEHIPDIWHHLGQ
jgi:hypothetical protein